VLARLSSHKDLGVHSEMCPDGVVPLIEAGVNQRRAQDAPSGQGGGGIHFGSQVLF